MITRRARVRCSVALAASSALLLAGCGGSSGSKTATGTTAVFSSSPAPVSTSATVTSPSSPSGSSGSGSVSASSSAPATGGLTKAKLLAILLQPADLGTGWKANPASSGSDSGDAADQAALIACLGGRNTDPDKVLDVDSPDYTSGTATVSSSASTYKSQSDVASDIALLKNPKVNTCYAKQFRTAIAKTLPAGATLNTVTFTVTPGPVAGIANVAGSGSGTVTVTEAGKRVTVYLGVTFVTGPKLEIEVTTETVDEPVPAAARNKLVAAVAARAAKG